MDRKDTKEIVNTLSRFVNVYGNGHYKEFAKEMMYEHRTLQQNCMRLFMSVIKEWSEQKSYDARNEATILLSRKIMESVKDDNYLPFI